MGKIRIKTIGDEEAEKKDLKKAQARTVAKKAREDAEARRATTENATEGKDLKPEETKTEQSKTDNLKTEKSKSDSGKQKTENQKTGSKKSKSESYKRVVALIDKSKKYKLAEALPLLEKLKRSKFDETVELHINTFEKGVSGSLTLPHGTGKTMRVTVANAAANPKQIDELIKTIETGKIDFDVLIATPDSMPRLAKVARFLGPRGLMPNPKNGTVTPKPEEVAKKFAGGQFNFKTESKFPILHLNVGKLSFGDKKLAENITTAVKAIKTKNIKNATLKSTMSPGIKIDLNNL
jgi:large subunit ribosomal protein L1